MEPRILGIVLAVLAPALSYLAFYYARLWVRRGVSGIIDARNRVVAPFSGIECVMYEYEIRMGRELPFYDGRAMAAGCTIVTDRGAVKLLGMPRILDMHREKLPADARVREYIAATTFDYERHGQDGSYRLDRRTNANPNLTLATIFERRIVAGERVCVFGDSADGALTRSTRLIPGRAESIRLRHALTALAAAAAAVAAGGGAWVLLTGY